MQPTPQSHQITIRFGEFLLEQRLITEAQLLESLADHWSNGGRIGAAICRRGFLSPDEVERQARVYHLLRDELQAASRGARLSRQASAVRHAPAFR